MSAAVISAIDRRTPHAAFAHLGESARGRCYAVARACFCRALETRRRGTVGYLCWGERTNRNALRCRSVHVAKVLPQTEQSCCPGPPITETDSAIKYEEPQTGQITSTIFITQYSGNVPKFRIRPRTLDTGMTMPRRLRRCLTSSGLG